MDSYNNRGRCPGVMCSITTCTLVNTGAGGAPMLFREKGELTGVSRCWVDWIIILHFPIDREPILLKYRHFRLCPAIFFGRAHVARKQKRPWVNCLLQNMEMWPQSQSGMSMISFYKYHTIWPEDKLTQIPFFPPHFISSPSGLGSPARSPRFI